MDHDGKLVPDQRPCGYLYLEDFVRPLQANNDSAKFIPVHTR